MFSIRLFFENGFVLAAVLLNSDSHRKYIFFFKFQMNRLRVEFAKKKIDS